jgi:hypothetical protein
LVNTEAGIVSEEQKVQHTLRARGLARQATEDRIRAERTLEVLKKKEWQLCNEALLAEAALAGVIS